MAPNKRVIIALLSLAGAVVLLNFFVSGELYSTIYDENGIIEMLTAISYGVAALIALVGAIRSLTKNGINRVSVGLLGFFVFGLFLVAEEISIWTIFMSSEPPRVLGIRMDAAHDILHLGLKAVKSLIAYSLPVGLSLIAVVTLTCMATLYWFRDALADGMRSILSTPVGTYIFVCIALGCAALVADLRSETFLILKSVEEGLELAASISLVIAALYAYSLASPKQLLKG